MSRAELAHAVAGGGTGHRGPGQSTRREAREFIVGELARRNDQAGKDLIDIWTEERGGSVGTIFRARDDMVAEGELVVDDARKPQRWHLIQAVPGRQI